MISAKEAKAILSKKFPILYVRSCLDFGKFFGFFLAPVYIPPDEPYETGVFLTAVDKLSGRVYDYDLTSDPELYLNAKPISV